MLTTLLSAFGSGGSSLAIYALVAFGLLAGGFAEGYHIASDAYKAAQLDAEKKVEAAQMAEAKKDNAASANLESKEDAEHAKAQVVTRTVDRIVDRPVYLNVCLDADGLRVLNDAITGAPADASQPDGAVPGPANPVGR